MIPSLKEALPKFQKYPLIRKPFALLKRALISPVLHRGIRFWNRVVPHLFPYSPRHIHIAIPDQSLGLFYDAKILQHTLSIYGYKIQFIKAWQPPLLFRKAQTNILLESLPEDILPLARKNMWLPNPEFTTSELMSRSSSLVDLIGCKTRDTERRFTPYHPHVHFLSFTSRDRFQACEKQPLFIHLPGKSKLKGTRKLIEVWNRNSELPTLIIRNYGFDYSKLIKGKNIDYRCGFIDDQQMQRLQNTCYFHLCPSAYEGFGHYINEAKSAGGIVFTTNAPPMNEMIDETCGFVINCKAVERYGVTELFEFHEDDLVHKIENALSLPQAQIAEMSRNARQSYISGKEAFERHLKAIIGTGLGP